MSHLLWYTLQEKYGVPMSICSTVKIKRHKTALNYTSTMILKHL